MKSELCVNILQTFCERESYWIRQRIESLKDRKVALFPAALTSQRFYHSLRNDYGIEVEYFIDNNPEMCKKSICGKSVKTRPWESNPHFAEEFVVLVPTSRRFYLQIAKQLEQAGISTHMHYGAFVACQYWDRYKNVLKLLDDEKSKLSYLSAIYSILTNDNSFIQYEKDQYFSVKEFSNNSRSIIVDAGAYVGDTLEEYVNRGFGRVKIYAFEPSAKAIEKIKERVKRLEKENFLNDNDIVIVEGGVGAETQQSGSLMMQNSFLKLDEQGDARLSGYSLDDYFEDKEPFTHLKADVEGMEMDMLKGAA